MQAGSEACRQAERQGQNIECLVEWRVCQKYEKASDAEISKSLRGIMMQKVEEAKEVLPIKVDNKEITIPQRTKEGKLLSTIHTE